jgi:hypothetical protein
MGPNRCLAWADLLGQGGVRPALEDDDGPLGAGQQRLLGIADITMELDGRQIGHHHGKGLVDSQFAAA